MQWFAMVCNGTCVIYLACRKRQEKLAAKTELRLIARLCFILGIGGVPGGE